MDSNKLCVILGAGASHGVATEGNEVFSPENQPPLANQLFDLKSKPSYQYITGNYEGAAFLSSYLGPTIARAPTAMEEELRTLASSKSPQINMAFAQIPMYLQHLIAYTTTNFVSRPGAYDQLLIQLFNSHNPNVLFIVMNYDLLLERSLEQFDGTKFERSEDYFTSGVNLLKPHGSVNWWAVLSGTREEYNQANITWDKVKSGMEEDFVIRSNIPPMRSVIRNVWETHLEASDDLMTKYGQPRQLFPLITAPMASKTISDFVCPTMHTDKARDFLNNCENSLIVGLSGLDTDLLEFLNSAIPRPPAIVHLAGPGNDKNINPIRERFIGGVTAFQIADQSGRFQVHRQEFTEYLKEFGVASLLKD